MRLYICSFLLFVFASNITPAYADSQQDWATASDIGAYGLSAFSLGLPLVKGDNKGALQAAGSFAGAQLTTQALKNIFPETRPDQSNRHSFPSGHTATAFAAAASIYKRQGSKIGVPAFLVAGLVGVARVKADKHFWYDAVAGAGIGLASGILITHQRQQNLALVPWGDSHGAGVSMAMRF